MVAVHAPPVLQRRLQNRARLGRRAEIAHRIRQVGSAREQRERRLLSSYLLPVQREDRCVRSFTWLSMLPSRL